MQDARQHLLELQKLATSESEDQDALLERVTDLFFVTAPHRDSADTAVFGDIMERIAYELEVEARAQLSKRLAAAENAPHGLITRLAHDEIAVARPVLESSPCLSEADLVAIAHATDQDHLHAISGRRQLGPAVTDVIVQRGDDAVLARVAGNAGASFSDEGLEGLSRRADANTKLFSAMENRRDVPEAMLEKVKRAVAARLRREIAGLYPGVSQEDIDRMVAAKAPDMDMDAFEESNPRLSHINGNGGITEAMVMAFARHKRLPETVHSLALMNDLSLSRVSHCLLNADLSALAMLCKANTFNARTFAALIQLRSASTPVGARAIAEAMRYYNALKPQNARDAIATLKQRLAQARSEKEKAAAAAAG